MFKRILVALDNSSKASSVFNFALSEAQPEKSEILLVHFIDWQIQNVPPRSIANTMYSPELSAEHYDWNHQLLYREIEIGKAWLNIFSKKATQLNISCKYECQIGNCSLGICERAKEWSADLIVMGRRGHRNSSEIPLGSVSSYVVHHATCSVLTAQSSKVAATKELISAIEV